MKSMIPQVVLAAVMLAGCVSTGGDEHVVTVDPEQPTTATVEVSSADDRTVKSAVQHAVDTIGESETEADGGWFIYVVCDEGFTGYAENAVALVRFAKGEAGATEIGLEEGTFDFRRYAGATCPGTAEAPPPE